jgi:hypothetical protein
MFSNRCRCRASCLDPFRVLSSWLLQPAEILHNQSHNQVIHNRVITKSQPSITGLQWVEHCWVRGWSHNPCKWLNYISFNYNVYKMLVWLLKFRHITSIVRCTTQWGEAWRPGPCCSRLSFIEPLLTMVRNG